MTVTCRCRLLDSPTLCLLISALKLLGSDLTNLSVQVWWVVLMIRLLAVFGRLQVTPLCRDWRNSSGLRGMQETRWCRSCRRIRVTLRLLTWTVLVRTLEKCSSRWASAAPLSLDRFIRLIPLLGRTAKLKRRNRGLLRRLLRLKATLLILTRLLCIRNRVLRRLCIAVGRRRTLITLRVLLTIPPQPWTILPTDYNRSAIASAQAIVRQTDLTPIMLHREVSMVVVMVLAPTTATIDVQLVSNPRKDCTMLRLWVAWTLVILAVALCLLGLEFRVPIVVTPATMLVRKLATWPVVPVLVMARLCTSWAVKKISMTNVMDTMNRNSVHGYTMKDSIIAVIRTLARTGTSVYMTAL